MTTYTTCADCGEIMQLVWDNQTIHPGCTPVDQGADYYATAIRAFTEAAMINDSDTANRHATVITEMDDSPPQFLRAALLYAEWGWPVFPCVPGGKEPATAHGFHDATTSKEVVAQWWQRTPNYNIGIATGHTFDAVDVDVPEGIWHWATLRDSTEMPDVHGWNTTPTGGFHVLVEPTGAGNTTRAYPGIDYRGLGGYIVCPPSVRSDEQDRRYRWAVKPSPQLTTNGK